jgi:hypothetical protein
LLQNDVEGVIELEYMNHCDGRVTAFRSKDMTTYHFDLSTCSTHVKITDGEYRAELYNDLVHDAETKRFVCKCSCGTIQEEERQKFTLDQKDPVNRQLLQERVFEQQTETAPQTLHDVGDCVCNCGFIDFIPEKHKMNY